MLSQLTFIPSLALCVIGIAAGSKGSSIADDESVSVSEIKSDGRIRKKKKSRKPAMVASAIIAMALVAALAAFLHLGGFARASKEASPATENTAMLPLDTFVLNLADRNANKLIKVTACLEISGDQAAISFAKTKTSQIRDAFISILASKSYEDLITAEGRMQLKDEMVSAAIQAAGGEGMAGKSLVRNIYFTDFVMQ